MKTLLTVLASCILAACGGGGTSEPAAAQQSACSHVVRIQLFGDSTLWGYDGAAANGTRASVYPELALQQAMDARFGAGAVVVESRAASGMRTSNLLYGTDGVNLPWPQSVNADIAVVSYGINDKYIGLTPEQYQDNLAKLTVAPAKVLFMTPLPVSTSTPVSGYAEYMRAVATKLNVPVADASAYALSMPEWWYYAPDGVHPSSMGYQTLATSVLAPAVAPLVAAARCK